MNENIKLDNVTKSNLKAKLDNVDSLVTGNVNQLVEIMAIANQLSDNPEIYNIVTSLEQIVLNKTNVNKSIVEFKEKMDYNLQQIIELDESLSSKFNTWN